MARKMINKQSFLMTWTILYLILLSVVEGMRSSQGRKFFLGFMENKSKDNNNFLYITTFATYNIHVIVRTPKWYTPHLIDSFYVRDGEVHKVTIGPHIRMEGTGLSTKGIFIFATANVAVYGVNSEKGLTDAYLGLPTDVIGTTYYAVTHTPKEQAMMLIVGTEDSTIVKIQLANNSDTTDVVYNGRTYRPGDTITVLMNESSTFQVTNEGDLTGSYVTANKPISFFSGNSYAYVGVSSYSHLVEQFNSVDTWYTRTAMMSSPANEQGDYFKIITSAIDTHVSYTCRSGENFTSNSLPLSKAGEFAQIFVGPGSYCYMESNKPILAVQFACGTGFNPPDQTMLLVPPLKRSNAKYTFTTPRRHDGQEFDKNFFFFIINSQQLHGIRLNGQSIPNIIYGAIPNTTLFGGYFEIADGTHSVRHTACELVFNGFIIGRSRNQSYGVPLYFVPPDNEQDGLPRSLNCDVRSGGCVINGDFRQVKKNYNMVSGQLWQKDDIPGIVKCAALCLMDLECFGYTYNKEEQLCRAHGRFACTSLRKAGDIWVNGYHYWAYL